MSALRQPTPPAETPPVAALPATSRETLHAIREAYTFVDASDEAMALGMLAQRPDVAAVLLEALPHVYANFGNGSHVLLDVIDDHSGEPLRVSARIITAADPDARSKLLDFYATWWDEASDPVTEALSFGLTYA